MDSIVNAISALIGNNYLATIIMSFIPLIELKGSIIYALGSGIEFYFAFLLSYLGSTIVFFGVFWLLKPVLKLLKKIKLFKVFATKLEYYFKVKAQKSLQKENGKGYSENFIKKLSVFIFVAIPLPMTGVWTGTAVAVFLDLDFKDAVLPVALGNLVAGVLITGLAELFIAFFDIGVLDYILWALFGIALILFIFAVIKICKIKTKDGENV